MIEDLRRTSAVTETGCRRSAVEMNGERKKLELRRPKLWDDQIQLPAASGEEIPSKKKKIVKKEGGEELVGCSNRKVAVVTLKLATSCSNHLPLAADGVLWAAMSSSRINDEKGKGITCWSRGSVMSVIGRRREMEDAVAVELGFMKRGPKVYDFFGVYDGHGGSRVAHVCRDNLHRLLAETVYEENLVNNNNGDDKEIGLDWKKVMSESFKKVDDAVNINGAAVATMGSTAVVAVVGEEELVVANCGDSRAVLSRGGVVMALPIDHKPDRPDELERIEISGGKVVDWNGQRVLGVLATSRSIGDHYLKPYIIAEPEVIVRQRSSDDEFLILASDGLWDVVSNDVACNVVRKCLNAPKQRSSAAKDNIATVAEAAAILTELAIARGSRDNISVIVVDLMNTSMASQ